MCSLEAFPHLRATTPFARDTAFWPSSHCLSLGLNILIPTCIHSFIRQSELSLYSLPDSVLRTLHRLVQLLREAFPRTLSFFFFSSFFFFFPFGFSGTLSFLSRVFQVFRHFQSFPHYQSCPPVYRGHRRNACGLNYEIRN